MRRSFNGIYPVTRSFGIYDPAYSNYPGSKHPGTDYGLPANTQLVAGMTGLVSIYDRDSGIKVGRGKEVVITNGNKQRKTCHMNRIDVNTGQWVNEGTPIGLSGYTGYVVDAKGNVGTPGGAHLHDELLVNGVYVNLEEYLKGGEMPYTDEQYNNLKADRDRYAQDWARLYYTLAGVNPASISSGDTRARLSLTWEQALRDLERDLPIADGISPYELRQTVKELEDKAKQDLSGNFKAYDGPGLFVKE